MDYVNEIEEADRIITASPQGEQRIPMTYSEFLHRIEDSTHAEWVNGEAIVFMPPNIRHQDIVVFLLTLIDGFVKVFGLGKTLTAPCEMRLEEFNSSREPDILFVSNENFPRIATNRVLGPADLVIEVISKESAARDRTDKFYEYQAAGVREYWVIDPRPRMARADFWVLDADSRYRPVPIGADGIYHSTVLPDFRLNVNDLLAEELPSPLRALAAMIGPDTLMRALGSNP